MSVELEEAKTSEDEGSLASIRERHRQQRVFSGHPAELAGPIGSDEEEEPQGKHVQPPPGESPGDSPGEEGGIPEQPKEGGEEGFKPKYKSQEEAEKAHREAERKMHEATTRAAELERENEELRSKQPPPAPPVPSPEEIEAQVAEVLGEIDSLDPYADDYATQRARLWSKVATLQGRSAPDETTVTQTVKKVLDEERRVENERRQKEDEQKTSRQAAIKMAREAGLDMGEKTHDSFLFWDALNRAPMHEGVTLEEQVSFMISEAKAEKARRAAARSETAPEQTTLERGAKTPRQPPSSEEGKPRRLNDIREKWREERRL
jgi:hypothetical protein